MIQGANTRQRGLILIADSGHFQSVHTGGANKPSHFVPDRPVDRPFMFY